MELFISKRYNAEDFEAWNRFVASSKNGTFLLDRNFMDYHADRFEDTSLLFYEGKRLVAVLPANYDKQKKTVYSHQGLTYGGLIMSHKITAKRVMEAFDLMLTFFRNELGAEHFIYKPIPYIYNRYASEEDLYALFRHDAKLTSRGLSSCIELEHRLPITESRKSGLRKAANIDVEETTDVDTFWKILNDLLTRQHNAKPVHTVDEIKLLMGRFPNCIKLYGAFDGKKMLAGSLLFICGEVVHTQYLAATDEGKACGALDKLITTLISDKYRNYKYFDIGTSMKDGGPELNEGLIFQKEGFGGRGVCYDQWEVELIHN